MAFVSRVPEYLRRHGASWTIRRGFQKLSQRLFRTGDRVWAKRFPSGDELASQRKSPPDAPLISVITPVYNTDPAMLRALLDSLSAQTYPRWEAVLYSAGTREGTENVLREAAERDPRFRVFTGNENRGIALNTNAALALAEGEYIALADHDDVLRPDALYQAAVVISRDHPDMIYSDEDRLTEDGRHHMDPHDKPDFCPETLLCANYICHLTLIRRGLIQNAGGLREGFDGSQDHELFLRLSEQAKTIAHIPLTLYSWREVSSSMSHEHLDQCLRSGCRAAEEHLARLGFSAEGVPVDREIRLWIDIPRDASIDAFIFGPTQEECEEGLAMLDFLSPWPSLAASLLVTDSENLFSSINEAAAGSSSDYILLMDSSLRDINRHFIRELLMYAQLPGVCAVSPVITDRRNHIIHGGFRLCGPSLVSCDNENLFVTAGGDHDIMNRVHNVSAVSPCCALIPRKYLTSGISSLFDAEYRTGLGMADWCLRQKKTAEARCVFTPHASAVLEKSSLLLSGAVRDPDDSARFRAAWGDAPRDPCLR